MDPARMDSADSEESDCAAVEGGTGGDFASRYRQSCRLFWRIAAGIVGDAATAEDIVQEAAMVALGKFGQFKAGTSFNAWMGQIVRYTALNHARKRQKRRANESDTGVLENVADRGVGGSHGAGFAGDTVGGRGFDERIGAALGEASEVARACLLLRTLDGLEYSEISSLLGIPEGTAMSHVHRTRSMMRRRLEGLGYDGSGVEGRSR